MYLFNPDPDDPFFRSTPGLFRAELNDRFTAPLYCLVFALVPLLFLGQASSARQSRSASIAAVVVLAVLLRAVPVFINAQSAIGGVLLYILPLAESLAIALLVLAGVQFKPPEWIVAFGEGLFARASGLVSRAPAPASPRR